MDKKKPSRIDVIGSNTNDGFHYFCGNCVNKDSELCGECFREGFVDYGIDKEPLHYKRSIKPIIRDTAEDAMQDAMLYGIGLHYLDVKGQMMEGTRTKQDIAAEAYQILGSLAYDTGVFENENVIRALDYFWGIANDEGVDVNILPWGLNQSENGQHDLES